MLHGSGQLGQQEAKDINKAHHQPGEALPADRQELLIEVRDSTPESTPLVGTSSLGEHRGHGMRMVESLCRDWGVRRAHGFTIVWASLPILP